MEYINDKEWKWFLEEAKKDSNWIMINTIEGERAIQGNIPYNEKIKRFIVLKMEDALYNDIKEKWVRGGIYSEEIDRVVGNYLLENEIIDIDFEELYRRIIRLLIWDDLL